MTKSIILFFLLSNTLIISTLNAQAFESIYDARSEALGRAVSVLDGASSIFGNPAAMVLSPQKNFTLGGQSRFLLTDVQMIQAGAAFAKKDQQFGFSAQYFGNQHLKKYTIGGQYARKLLDKLDAGIRIRGGQLDLGTYGNRTYFDADLGIQTKLNNQLSFGALLQNLMRFRAAEQEQAGTALRLGVAYLPSKKVKMVAELLQDFKQGIAFQAGVEYLPTSSLVFRVGTRTNPVTPSFGISYAVNNTFTIDSFATYDLVLGVSTGVNLGVQF
jgi:hypothetical protein